ncbi:1,4-dihydroxy-2-naphthoate polyprenyltransferase [Bacteroidota bacterium]
MKSSNFSSWLEAARLRTLPLALASIITGSFMAASKGQYDWIVFGFSVITTVLLQVLSNFANDYGDYQHGADSDERKGPSRAVQSGMISPGVMKKGIIITMALAFISGIVLLLYSLEFKGTNFWVFLLIGMAAIMAALFYTMGKKPYGYAGLGDLFVLIFFGLVGVLGTFYLYTGYINWPQILPSMSMGCFATAVLNVNNIRDIKSDQIAGKMSIPVRIGRDKAIIYHWMLMVFGSVCAGIYTLVEYYSNWQWIFLLAIPFLFLTAIGVTRNSEPRKLDPYLKRTALSVLLFALMFGLGLIL